MGDEKVLHGFYSQKACDRFGYAVYLNESGKEVKVTGVYDSVNPPYYFEDKVYVGIVTKFVRSTVVSMTDSTSDYY